MADYNLLENILRDHIDVNKLFNLQFDKIKAINLTNISYAQISVSEPEYIAYQTGTSTSNSNNIETTTEISKSTNKTVGRSSQVKYLINIKKTQRFTGSSLPDYLDIPKSFLQDIKMPFKPDKDDKLYNQKVLLLHLYGASNLTTANPNATISLVFGILSILFFILSLPIIIYKFSLKNILQTSTGAFSLILILTSIILSFVNFSKGNINTYKDYLNNKLMPLVIVFFVLACLSIVSVASTKLVHIIRN